MSCCSRSRPVHPTHDDLRTLRRSDRGSQLSQPTSSSESLAALFNRYCCICDEVSCCSSSAEDRQIKVHSAPPPTVGASKDQVPQPQPQSLEDALEARSSYAGISCIERETIEASREAAHALAKQHYVDEVTEFNRSYKKIEWKETDESGLERRYVNPAELHQVITDSIELINISGPDKSTLQRIADECRAQADQQVEKIEVPSAFQKIRKKLSLDTVGDLLLREGAEEDYKEHFARIYQSAMTGSH